MPGSVKVWDPRQKDKPVANMAPAEGEEGRDCWCVAFGKLFKHTYVCMFKCAFFDFITEINSLLIMQCYNKWTGCACYTCIDVFMTVSLGKCGLGRDID